MTKKIFTVNGMKCQHCEAHVEEAVKALAGVSEAKADKDSCKLALEIDDALVTDNQIQDAVNGLGRYELTLD